jgi:hypothetical protein
MTIEINNDYPTFRVTHTLHQLVDKLNEQSEVLDANIRLIDSALNSFMDLVDVENSMFHLDSNFVINSNGLKFEDSAYFTVNSPLVSLKSENMLTVKSGGIIRLEAENDYGNVVLRSNELTYGALRNNEGNLQVMSGLQVGLSFDGQDIEVNGIITMPSTGDGAPETTSKTIDGALTELNTRITEVDDSIQSVISDLDQKVTSLEGNYNSFVSRISDLESDMSYLMSLNIESKLNSHTSRLENIEQRLGLIGI